MRSPSCLFSTGAALRRVFITNGLESSPVSFAPSPARLFLPKLYNDPQVRTAFMMRKATNGTPEEARGGGRGPKTKGAKLPRNREIAQLYSLIVMREDDNKLSEPVSPQKVLSSLDPINHTLQVVALPDPDNERAPPYPICLVIDKKAEQARSLALKKAARKKSVQSKEMELNWAIDPHDLEHRMRQLKGFLEKGMRVQIMLATKRRKRVASKDEAEAVLAKIMEAVAEVPGAKEVATREGVLLKTMKMHVEGRQGG
ncbi:putative translation initiation factor if-3 protein [Phaeoacremonium minimum UCRPA7]|uniref:Putative translation initiation factor if-3 protein n=1 Tax=Phaeoacremonium minimum (strain UCR-PA7) TaxID=1286976 RepID=R8BE71_PHAM7|nr:putative translation initiation factor if-3 protein [Phaeoacremonium minimum UCRPA7]EON97601.1 putative translation initiation factor if-3 protein [Phaeoacremonium minimum UCRPA7]